MIANTKTNDANKQTQPEDSSKSQLKSVKPKSTITVLDGVRAFACFMVIAYHINYETMGIHLWSAQGVGPVVTGFALAGAYGVTLFFVLSGFLLFMPYVKAILFDAPWPSIRRYYIRRIFRILPGYYISLALIILFFHREYLNPDHWYQMIFFLTFFMDASRTTYQNINGPFWTLAVEWQFYMLLPLLALGFRWIAQRGSLQRRLTCLWLCLLGLVAWGIASRYWGHSWILDPTQPALLPAPLHTVAAFFLYGRTGKFLEDFGIGMLICLVYMLAQQKPQHILSRLCKKYSPYIWACGVLTLIFAALWPYTFLIHSLRQYIGAHNWLSEMPYAIGFGLCVLALLFAPPNFRPIFEWKPVRWIGQLSYGMYIWHLPTLSLFALFILPLIHTKHSYLKYGAYWLVIFLVLIPCCYVFYRIVEKPSMRFGNWLIHNKIHVE
jgi:peptidoglycan/LPS O-acetylase OafA/YrhL